MKTGPEGYFDDSKIAEDFDKERTSEAALYQARSLSILLKKFTNMTRESLCLSVGCGSGAKEQFIASDNLICLDIAKEMLKLAAQKGLTCVQGSALNLPFRSNTFDCVFAIDLSTLHYTEDMANTTIKESGRICSDDNLKCI